VSKLNSLYVQFKNKLVVVDAATNSATWEHIHQTQNVPLMWAKQLFREMGW
jgi:hypothetical protein